MSVRDEEARERLASGVERLGNRHDVARVADASIDQRRDSSPEQIGVVAESRPRTWIVRGQSKHIHRDRSRWPGTAPVERTGGNRTGLVIEDDL